ncbi:MAG: extracellular solute-binding protein [Angustibacter sp.]
MRRRRRQRAGAAALALASVLGLVACGDAGDSSRTTLTWYINPDNGGQADLAARCTRDSGGRYRITTTILPNDADSQREQLLRRLSAGDSSMDLMSLDPVFVAEFAEAGFLSPVPRQDVAEVTRDTVRPAVESSTWKGQLVAAPLWANTQLLWYRKSVVEAAGLDLDRPVDWQQLIRAAQQQRKTVAVQAAKQEGYTVWLNALIAGAGGQVVDNPTASADQIRLGIDTPAGRDAADVISELARADVGGPSLSTSAEEESRALFQGPVGGFMVNWIYVWTAIGEQAPQVRDDIGWAPYPQTVAGRESRPPFGGIELAVGADSPRKELAHEAVTCLTSQRSQTEYMLSSGNPAAKRAVYEDPEVREAFPMAADIVASLDRAAPRPITPYYGDVSLALQDGFHPASAVDPGSTPASTQLFLQQVLRGEKLL